MHACLYFTGAHVHVYRCMFASRITITTCAHSILRVAHFTKTPMLMQIQLVALVPEGSTALGSAATSSGQRRQQPSCDSRSDDSGISTIGEQQPMSSAGDDATPAPVERLQWHPLPSLTSKVQPVHSSADSAADPSAAMATGCPPQGEPQLLCTTKCLWCNRVH